MYEMIVPKEVKFTEIRKNGSLSPNNYKKLAIQNKNQHKIAFYMDDNNPFFKGIEPGSGAYVSKSSQRFLRNSCINNIQFGVDKDKYISLNPNYYTETMVSDGDVLFCTDANIGDCCLFVSDDEKVCFSSGIIKLNFKQDRYKYYVMAFLRDEYFRAQLNAKTPKGATIRHSGNLFLKCKIPDCPEDWVYSLVENLIKNIVYAEHNIGVKLRKSEEIIREEIMFKQYVYVNPSIKQLKEKEGLIPEYIQIQYFSGKKTY